MKEGLFYLCCYLYCVSGFILVHNVPRNVTKTLVVDNGGRFGDWRPPQFCAEGSYAVGYDMKIEPDQGTGDDTALNAIQLLCARLDGGQFGGMIISAEGKWGTWVGETKCDPDKGHFLTSFTLQVEDYQNALDDTAANFVKFMCRDFASAQQPYEIFHGTGHGTWGNYGTWSESCGANSAICGIQAKIEDDQYGLDDTALNDVKMFCCD